MTCALSLSLSLSLSRSSSSNDRSLVTGGDVYADGDLLAPEFLEVCEAQVSLLEHALDVPTSVTVRAFLPSLYLLPVRGVAKSQPRRVCCVRC